VSDIAAIRAADARMPRDIRQTPLLGAPALDRIAGRRLWVKAECLQVTGSFKARGAWAALSALPPADRAAGVLAYSSGNHAQAIAWAAARHGVPAVILMPADAPRAKIAGAKAFGAEVVTYDRATQDRDALGAELARARGLALIPPFDHPQVIAGQGTVGLELARQVRDEGVESADVAVCCGGGGLSAGIALALEAEAPGLRLRTVEPAGFDDMARSLAAGAPRANTAMSGSICDAILTPAPGRLTLPVLAGRAGPGLTVTDATALEAMALAFRHLRLVLEPGGAVALAAALSQPEAFAGDTVIVVATGGNVDADLFCRAIAAA
jgi:threonine dehydratase